MNPRTLIIGSGLAGITLVRELRKQDKGRAITIVTADDGAFYSKPNLSNAFAANKRPEDMVLTPADKLERDLDIQIMTHTTVTRIDTGGRKIECTQGTLTYNQLVLAIGASQIPLPLAGDGVPDSISINSLADYTRLRSRLDGKRSIAIVGAGLIGCEFANDLRLGGFAVDVFDQIEQPMGRLLPPAAAQQLRDKLVAIGIGFQASAAVGVVVTAAVLTHDFSDGINTVSMIVKNGGSRNKAMRWLFVDALAPTAAELRRLFPGCTVETRSLTLVPPLARRLGPARWRRGRDSNPRDGLRRPTA